MKPEIEKAIKILAERINAETKPDDALKLTQSALNLAHVAQVLKQTEITKSDPM